MEELLDKDLTDQKINLFIEKVQFADTSLKLQEKTYIVILEDEMHFIKFDKNEPSNQRKPINVKNINFISKSMGEKLNVKRYAESKNKINNRAQNK